MFYSLFRRYPRREGSSLSLIALFKNPGPPLLIFDAVLENEAGETLATAKSFHLIIGQ